MEAVNRYEPHAPPLLRRCPDCTDFLAHSRLTVEERHHRIDDIRDRPDDPAQYALLLRFVARRMLENPFGFLAVYGAKGSGKSLLLTSLTAEFCHLGRPAVYFNAGELVSLLRPHGADENEIDGFRYAGKGGPDSVKRRLMDEPVLAIDEIDKLKWSAYEVLTLGEIIEWRHRRAAYRVTLLSMNKPPWLWHNAGEVEPIASRLQDGRFRRQWPQAAIKQLPKCCKGNPDIPGLLEINLPDIRPTLRRKEPSPCATHGL